MIIQPDVFPVSSGTVTSTDGKQWTVPGPVADGPFAVDLYNDCSGPGDNPDWEKQLQTVVIDKDGVVQYSEQTPTPKELPNFNAIKETLGKLK